MNAKTKTSRKKIKKVSGIVSVIAKMTADDVEASGEGQGGDVYVTVTEKTAKDGISKTLLELLGCE